MKKEYIKPGIIIEDFTISQSISAGCGAHPGGNSTGKPNHWNKTTCGWQVGNGIVLWLDELANPCTEGNEENEIVSGICYNNPEGGNSIFSS